MTNGVSLVWKNESVSSDLRIALELLSGHYPMKAAGEGRGRNAVQVEFRRGAPAGSLSVRLEGGVAVVSYDKVFHALRAVGALLSGLIKPGKVHTESASFETVGIMLDCSRNAVMTVEHFKGWLRKMALMGYNMAMLYTEDTYAIPGEDYFGYKRGRYTEKELRDIDAYAAGLGIEMIGCIQTLGHLEQILKWPAYRKIMDTSSVLMAEDENTYKLVEKMIATSSRSFRSRRIHVGMDETHDLGRGSFMDKFGYKRGYDIFNQHLEKVIDLCGRYGLKPMIWSDMYFRMGSKTQAYYDADCKIPADIKKQIPKNIQLVYWDYYREQESAYLEMIRKHRDLGFDPPMASGIWTWVRLVCDMEKTRKTVLPCISACRKSGSKEIFFTMWGDDGAYAEFDSALAGMAFSAEYIFAGEAAREQDIARRFQACCGGDYKMVKTASEINTAGGDGVCLLWDDPLLGIYWTEKRLQAANHWTKALKQVSSLCSKLEAVAAVTKPVDFKHILVLAEFLKIKIELRLALDKAYASRKPAELRKVKAMLGGVIQALDALMDSFRTQWFRRNKEAGFETIQIRLAGQKERYVELGRRLDALLNGSTASIPEMDEVPAKPLGWPPRWRGLAAGTGIL